VTDFKPRQGIANHAELVALGSGHDFHPGDRADTGVVLILHFDDGRLIALQVVD
jgi:hypothetical protein